jgi:GAF domain-containing protein
MTEQVGKVESMSADPAGRDQTGESSQSDPLAALTTNLSETAEILFSAGGVHSTLEQVIAVAVHTIEGCDFAGLFLLEGGVIVTPVLTDQLVDEIDTLQRDSGEGPCLDAIAQRVMVYGEDLQSDDRWPNFSVAAVGRGIRSVLALPLTTHDTIGAVNLYATYPAAFGVLDRAKGVILASLASVAVNAAHSLEDEERRVENLHSALSSREIIGQAQGILMERERIAADQAFDVLRRASQYLNIKLREVAQTLVDTGERPETGPRPRSSDGPAGPARSG